MPPNATLEIDLTLLGWHKVEKVTPDGGVIKKTLTPSEEWKTPGPGASATVAYAARLPDGTVFDERGEADPLTFTTEEGEVPEGLDLAVMKMKKGEVAVVTVGPSYGYGDEGTAATPKAAVPGGATLTYEVTLMDFAKVGGGVLA